MPDEATPGPARALEVAASVGVSSEEVFATVDLATARAEIAWLERRPEEVERETAAILDEAVRRGATDNVARLSYWRRLAGLEVSTRQSVSGPYAPGSRGAWREAAAEWSRRECPYETALALAEADDETALRSALEECRRLEARPLAAVVTRRLREIGARVPRGPRSTTRENPAHPTARELEVLRHIAAGLRNSVIADRLVLSRRTIDHHVSAILRKLDANTRGEAVAAAQADSASATISSCSRGLRRVAALRTIRS